MEIAKMKIEYRKNSETYRNNIINSYKRGAEIIENEVIEKITDLENQKISIKDFLNNNMKRLNELSPQISKYTDQVNKLLEKIRDLKS